MLDPPALARAFRELLEPLIASAASREEARELLDELRGLLDSLRDRVERTEEDGGVGDAAHATPSAPVERKTVVRELWGGKVVVADTGPAAPRAPQARRARPERGAATLDAHRRPRHDLELVLRRARIKAEACRMLLDRRLREEEGEAVDEDAETERRRELQQRARELRDGYVWLLDPRRAAPAADVLELLASCYENLARGLELARAFEQSAPEGSAPPEDVLHLLAEAQSALFVALSRVGVERDADQVATFAWLRDQTREHRIFVPRFMSLERTADPTGWRDLRERLDELNRRMELEREEEGTRREIAEGLRRELEGASAADPASARAAWSRIAHLLDRWVEGGRPPSSREVCEPLLPHLDRVPDSVAATPGAARVLEAAEEMRAAREHAARPEEARPQPPTPEVLRARELLRGKVVLLVGGEERPESRSRLEEELELGELRWISTRAHRSIEPIVQKIARPEVDLVLVAIRWSDHAFEDLQHATEDLGKVFVRLPAGYGVNRVAHDVLEQASQQLSS